MLDQDADPLIFLYLFPLFSLRVRTLDKNVKNLGLSFCDRIILFITVALAMNGTLEKYGIVNKLRKNSLSNSTRDSF